MTCTETPELTRWNQRYQGPDYLFGTAPNAFLASQRERLAAGGSALCIADGEGRNSVWLASIGLAVTAFDFSPVAVAKAQQLAQRAGVTVDYRVQSLSDWVWQPEAYDVVAAIFVQFAPPAERERMFAGIVQTLKPGGLLLLQGYRPEQLDYRTGGPSALENLYTEALLRDSLRDLEILQLRPHDELVDEGSGHRGMSALIDVVARKGAAQ